MFNFYKTVFILISIFSFSSSFANSFDILQIDTSSCNLTQHGSQHSDVVYKGKKERDMCYITVPIEVFNRSYSYCAISSITNINGGFSCGFTYFDNARKNVEFYSDNTTYCDFICLKK